MFSRNSSFSRNYSFSANYYVTPPGWSIFPHPALREALRIPRSPLPAMAVFLRESAKHLPDIFSQRLTDHPAIRYNPRNQLWRRNVESRIQSPDIPGRKTPTANRQDLALVPLLNDQPRHVRHKIQG